MFDLGNVIICFDHMIAAKKIARYCDKHPHEIYDLFFWSELTEKFDCGKIDEREFYSQIKRILNLNGLEEEGFFQIWNSIFWENPGIDELIEEIKKKYEKFFIISNVNKPHFEYIWERFPVVRKADEIILSYQVGCLKPASKIYTLAIEKAGCRPEEIFYTDDREELVVAARELGIQAEVFLDLTSLKKLLLGSERN